MSEIRGEIDWIVMKAWKRSDLGGTTRPAGWPKIQRYLANELVEARPPSTWYQLKKFYDRNKLLTSSVVAIIAALSIGLSIAIWGVTKAEKANRRLREQQGELDVREAMQCDRQWLRRTRFVIWRKNCSTEPWPLRSAAMWKAQSYHREG